jgi:hypothetical protein
MVEPFTPVPDTVVFPGHIGPVMTGAAEIALTVIVFVAVAFVHPVGAVAVKVSVIEPDSEAPAV